MLLYCKKVLTVYEVVFVARMATRMTVLSVVHNLQVAGVASPYGCWKYWKEGKDPIIVDIMTSACFRFCCSTVVRLGGDCR